MILQILERRLGEAPAAIHERLERCTLDQLNALVNPALDAATWDAFTALFPMSLGSEED